MDNCWGDVGDVGKLEYLAPEGGRRNLPRKEGRKEEIHSSSVQEGTV
jgi:hypothetical protein